MPPKKFFIIVSSTVTVALIAIFLSLSPNFIGADTDKTGAKDLSLGLGLQKGSVVLMKETQAGKPNFIISRKKWLFQRKISLTGFEEEANLCHDPKIDFPASTSSVCLTGEVGVHSMNLQIISLTATGLRPASFSSATKESNENINSDLPFFVFSDINDDGISDLAVYNRDYNSDPLQYAIKSYYTLDKEGNYYFDSEERIAYNVNSN